MVEVARFDHLGNLRLNGATWPTSLANGIALKRGVGASAIGGADQIALWSAEVSGSAGTAGVHLLTEDGTP